VFSFPGQNPEQIARPQFYRREKSPKRGTFDLVETDDVGQLNKPRMISALRTCARISHIPMILRRDLRRENPSSHEVLMTLRHGKRSVVAMTRVGFG
jgi:hypothetical protein